ncbi:hypothetical protein [Homoserinibacter sp. YIM 151385]|uniref:hypothetical protein n=1 Tax=Homoserinibacter sp. YIM 151385 TaxID=2985506 RepID=UPI0022F0BA90|nr:hypothetical protein [Homoserinibacter sp. YIM 151385]WBU38189.1 hypothetical protein OF852_00985 [Homoserinibacter sp. YIM 151385]
MSEIAEAASATIVLSDFAAVDAVGKTNVIGAGVAMLGFEPQQGLTSRFTVWVEIWIPSNLCPAEFPVEVAFRDASGALVSLPGPTGLQPLRIAQVVTAERPSGLIPASSRDHIGSRVQMVFEFGNGLPVPFGANYSVQLQIDGDSSRQWLYPFAVGGPPPGPVMG